MKKLQIFLVVILLLILSKNTAIATDQAYGSSAVLASAIDDRTNDNRAQILEDFLNSYNSPLSAYSGDFVKSADKYNLDWRLVASIAGVESTFGKHIPYNSQNAWGWGIYGDNVLRFNSWPEAIETISKGLREGYLKDNPESNPYVIGPTYAASPTWAVRVDYFMQKIEDYRLRNAKSTLTVTI